MEIRTQELNRIQVMKDSEDSCRRVLECLDNEIRLIEEALDQHVEQQAGKLGSESNCF